MIRIVEGVGVPGHAEAARDSVQRTAAAATATASGVSPGEHDGTIYDAKPDGAAVCDAADDGARTHTDAYDAAAANTTTADDGAVTADDGTNGAILSSGTAATIGWAAIGPATALCWIRNGIIHGEALLTVRGGHTGSFKK